MKNYIAVIKWQGATFEYSLNTYKRELGWDTVDLTHFAITFKGKIIDEDGNVIEDFTKLPF